MKIPKHIRMKLRNIATYSCLVEKNMKAVETWLESNGFDIEKDGLREGSGCSLEELEYGNDISEELCERIVRIAHKKDGDGIA